VLSVLVSLGSAGREAAADSLPTALQGRLEIDDEFVTGLKQPTAVTFLPDGQMLITERTGDLLLRNTVGSVSVAGHFSVNSKPSEQGLLNVAVHPDFTQNHLLYFYYSASAEAGGTDLDRHRVVSVELSDTGLLDMDSERILVRGLMGPDNHDGGGLSISGDYLFIGTGDTGHNSFSTPGNDIGNYFGTCLTNAQGKVLRVHLEGTIPSDNPLIGKTVTACPGSPGEVPSATSSEPRTDIFAWGFRNPFRLWADPKTGNVWVGNVGESTFEMLQVVPPSGGLHYGWPYREGNHGQGRESCQGIEPNVGDCTDAIYICEQSDNGGGYSTPAPDDPNVANGCDSISGGRILDDCQWPAELQGHYVFGDYQNNRVWALPVNDARDNVIGEREDLLRTEDGGPVSFAEHDGALYVVVHSGNGHITRIAPRTPEPACGGLEAQASAGVNETTAGVGTPAPDERADGNGACAIAMPNTSQGHTPKLQFASWLVFGAGICFSLRRRAAGRKVCRRKSACSAFRERGIRPPSVLHRPLDAARHGAT